MALKLVEKLIANSASLNFVHLGLVPQNDLGQKFAHVVMADLHLRLLRIETRVELTTNPKEETQLNKREVFVSSQLGER